MTTQQVIENGLSPMTYTTAGGTIIAGFTLGEWAAAIGAVATVATFILNWWYKHQMLKQTKRNK